MTKEEIKSMIKLLEAEIKERQSTIDKYQKVFDEQIKTIESKGWDHSLGKYQKAGTPDFQECHWMVHNADNAKKRIDQQAPIIAACNLLLEEKKKELRTIDRCLRNIHSV